MVYKGYELLKAIDKGEIKEGTEFEVNVKDKCVMTVVYKEGILKNKRADKVIDYMTIALCTFEKVESVEDLKAEIAKLQKIIKEKDKEIMALELNPGRSLIWY